MIIATKTILPPMPVVVLSPRNLEGSFYVCVKL
jgi:hypothetical protein